MLNISPLREVNHTYYNKKNNVSFGSQRPKTPVADVIDIKARGSYPANVLSNFAPTSFSLDGVEIKSMEGFLQSLKAKDKAKQKEICLMSGFDAKTASHALRQSHDDILYFWEGKSFTAHSENFYKLIKDISRVQKLAGDKPFVYHGYKVNSVNSLLLALRCSDIEKQKVLSQLSVDKIKEAFKDIKFKYAPRTLYWNGQIIKRDSKEYQELIKRAYKAKYFADSSFRIALRETKQHPLDHTKGKTCITETVLTKDEFLSNLLSLRKRDTLILKIKDFFKSHPDFLKNLLKV